MEAKVGIKSTKGRLQLVWSLAKQRYYLSLGLANTPQNRKVAKLQAAEIEKDIFYDRFDGTLDKYRSKPKSVPLPPKPNAEKPADLPPLLDLYQEYIEVDRMPVCAPSTYYHQFVSWANTLALCPHGLEDAHEIRGWLLGNCPPNKARRLLQSLNAMARWAVVARKLKVNPFEGMRIDSKKGSQTAEPDPWSREDRDRIIQAFRDSAEFRHYADLVEFLFLTGCRPSEALALNWGDVSPSLDRLIFRAALTSGTDGRKTIKQGLKRQKSRQIPLNRRLAGILDEMRANGGRGLIFTTPTGTPIDWPGWNKRIWHACLASVGMPRKKPYSTRHTFITLALKSGMSVADVAAIAGNSPEIIHRHYAGVSRDLRLPE